MTVTLDARTGGFPGFGEDAPLDLGNLPASAVAGLVSRFRNGTMPDLSDALASVGNCSHPIHLHGTSTTIDTATGQVLSEYSSADAPLGVLLRPCGNRRADVCPACSRTYARDTFAMIRSGLLGGKTVPETVADNPLVFATFTAPSFGHVHGTRPKNGHKSGGRCRPYDRTKTCPHGRPKACMTVHTEADPAVGAPLCSDCYDWTSAVIWQWHAPELWRRFTIALRRALVSHLDTTDKALRHRASVQYAKVAEFQARGLVHFHALIRLDGPNGPGSPSPVDGATLARLIRDAAPAVRVEAPPVDGADVPRMLAFGSQLDVRTVRTGLPQTLNPYGPDATQVEDPRTSDTLVPEQVAGYLAKYSTKSTGTDPDARPAHHRRLVRTCRWLAERARTACRGLAGPDPEDDDGCVCGQCEDSPYRLLGKWAHMLGFRGHFSTKSRRYSVTLGRLRAARAKFARLRADADRTGQPLDTRDLEARLLADDDATTLVIGDWHYTGTGWTTDGEKELAEAAAARAREYAQWKARRTA